MENKEKYEKNLYQSEMEKAFKMLGLDTSFDEGSGMLTVASGDKKICDMIEDKIFYNSEGFRNTECRNLYSRINKEFKNIAEYVSEYNSASPLDMRTEDYRELCEFNWITLAAKVLEDNSFQFAIFHFSAEVPVARNGRYFNDYKTAKAAFIKEAWNVGSSDLINIQIDSLYKLAKYLY